MELLQLLLPQLLQLLQIIANYWLLLNEVMRHGCSQVTANYCITATPQVTRTRALSLQTGGSFGSLLNASV